jgi:hypothetical protein
MNSSDATDFESSYQNTFVLFHEVFRAIKACPSNWFYVILLPLLIEALAVTGFFLDSKKNKPIYKTQSCSCI